MNEAIHVAQQAGIFQNNLAALMWRVQGSHYENTDLETAKHCFVESLALYEKLGDRLNAVDPLRKLGDIAWIQGEDERGNDYLQKAIAISREMNSKSDLMYSLYSCGDHAHKMGRYAESEACFQEAQALAEKTGFRMGVNWSLLNRGVAIRRQGHLERARRLICEGLELAQQDGYTLGVLGCIASLAGIAADLSRGLESARLMGAMVEAQTQQGFQTRTFGPISRIELQRDVSQLRNMLGDEAFEAAFLEGKVLTLEQAIQLAKEVVVP
jgi:tetratricopeptide (TPR) repeat protein